MLPVVDGIQMMLLMMAVHEERINTVGVQGTISRLDSHPPPISAPSATGDSGQSSCFIQWHLYSGAGSSSFKHYLPDLALPTSAVMRSLPREPWRTFLRAYFTSELQNSPLIQDAAAMLQRRKSRGIHSSRSLSQAPLSSSPVSLSSLFCTGDSDRR